MQIYFHRDARVPFVPIHYGQQMFGRNNPLLLPTFSPNDLVKRIVNDHLKKKVIKSTLSTFFH